METAQDRMRLDHFNQPQMSIVLSYKSRIKRAAEEGLLIFIKYGLALILAFFALQYMTSIISGASNGTNSPLYLNELISKGYLPKAVNGVIQPMGEQNATPVTK